ncbi:MULTISPECIES: beta-N-acetylhexosaminidase [Brucella/Ochrobactrum group]|uniref:beta-N-acetylhexosaminidase n=1 Tax=Brucella pseudintermedia TaxID=370111 RepID=A0ABY5UE02_9HYPH|nr:MULTISPECIES: beta-N-acetylhexosaminidase [Brucella/Ochrobactrum group]KAB2680733.1 beta-N-acetylhexosaminidase [Brucella pseudintermedia]MCO7725874.1 beta-N-acetylhexosaminidase [Brucella intermedia]NKE77381.1 beta-N-acetylhexosaminidase [Ochrobactrum sp. MC-1LL]TWG95740.1 beta-N-acetylhexosaminidase [Ochrobactrum sp. J50]UWL60587.1 beta-N-acetylhexosaminidase [Brucella pseudintermedia]
MIDCKAWIAGVSGTKLTEDEIAFFRDERPWGFILFARNVESLEQVSDLTAHMRDLTGRDQTPVFIDQEGGRVQRLRPPLVPNYPSASEVGAIYARDREAGLRAAWLHARLHAFDLLKVGVNVDCLPVLDVPVEGAHDVIGARAYSKNPHAVAAMGRAAAEGLLAGGLLPVVKHMPGHGRAFADTHKELARVTVPLNELVAHDFVPFKALNDLPMAMTAHVVFDCIDPQRPSTLSPTVINTIIRDVIQFDGLVMSDDISMKALSGSLGDIADGIVGAGCDMVLYCAGVMEELKEVAARVPVLEGKAKRRAELAEVYAGDPDLSNEEELRAEFGAMFELIA